MDLLSLLKHVVILSTYIQGDERRYAYRTRRTIVNMDFNKAIWIKNVHCRNIGVVNAQVGNKVVAVCSFDSTDGLYGLLINAVKHKWYADMFDNSSFTISAENTNTMCRPMVYEGTDPAIVAYERHYCPITASPTKRRLTPILRNETMVDVIDKRLVCMARVNLCFTNVTVEPDKYAPDGTQIISFDSFHTIDNPVLYARTPVELLK